MGLPVGLQGVFSCVLEDEEGEEQSLSVGVYLNGFSSEWRDGWRDGGMGGMGGMGGWEGGREGGKDVGMYSHGLDVGSIVKYIIFAVFP